MRFKKNRTRRKLNKTKQKSKRNNGGNKFASVAGPIFHLGKEFGKSILIDNAGKLNDTINRNAMNQPKFNVDAYMAGYQYRKQNPVDPDQLVLF